MDPKEFIQSEIDRLEQELGLVNMQLDTLKDEQALMLLELEKLEEMLNGEKEV